jgi:hypothetical protein
MSDDRLTAARKEAEDRLRELAPQTDALLRTASQEERIRLHLQFKELTLALAEKADRELTAALVKNANHEINIELSAAYKAASARAHKTSSGPGSFAIVSAPPPVACILLELLLSKVDRHTIPGDLEEEFRTRLAKYGLTGARLWFWGEALRTIAYRNPVCRWGLVNGLLQLGRWIARQLTS